MGYRIIPPNHVVEVTTRVEQGLLLAANPLVKLFIESSIARARELHPVTICHCLVESTHVHFLMVAHDPCEVRDFMERFKTESAHYINAMLGRRKRTIWCESYFCAPILTESSVMNKIKYIYTNPAKDGLENSIEAYPNISSWSAYYSGRHKKTLPKVTRLVIPYMPEIYSEHTYKQEVKKVKALCKETQILRYQPDAWMDVFKIPKEEREAKNRKIFRMIEEEEQKFRKLRAEQGKGVVGHQALRAAHLDTEYFPKTFGKQMWCISDDVDLRIRYIEWAKAIKQKARMAYERWRDGDYTLAFPPGVFPPTRRVLSNLAPLALGY